MNSNRELIVTKKTGFKVVSKNPVIIYDHRGKIFYDNSDLINFSGFFNLPIGSYYINSGDFIPLLKPVYFKLNDLPLPERNKKFPFDFEIIFENNRHKATINWITETISFDKSLLTLPLPHLYFILFHEFAHQKYKTEKLADAYAENQMLLRGFNPSQIAKASVETLSHRQFERKKETVNRLMNR